MIRFILKLWRNLFGTKDEQVHYQKVATSADFRLYLSTTNSNKTGGRLFSKTQGHYLEALYLEGFSDSTDVSAVYAAHKNLLGSENDWHLNHLSAGLYHLYIYHTGNKPKH